ncbi:hypothetical protein AXF42_Ash019843 [Apostasia shenzhenica]|uniref:Uncharacterized protein n=1 Tax=Apostasia shenzhenica TaxID=1088818 RepID=A0A2I0ARF4_9ASPA|nr:hypothetical protein AXF42_Ash019843 [Apostasia shenzhenica]
MPAINKAASEMTPICRSAAMAAVRSVASRSQTLLPKPSPSLPKPSPSLPKPSPSLPKPSPSRFAAPIFSRSFRSWRRLASAVGSVNSLMPLHSAVASSRLISNIAVDTSCWSWMSQGTIALNINQSFKFGGVDLLYRCDQGLLAFSWGKAGRARIIAPRSLDLIHGYPFSCHHPWPVPPFQNGFLAVSSTLKVRITLQVSFCQWAQTYGLIYA